MTDTTHTVVKQKWSEPRFKHFDSMEELLKDIEDSPQSEEHYYRSSTKDKAGGDWTPQNYEDTVNSARYGWPEGRAKLEKAKSIADATLLRATETRPKRRYDIAGAYPHAARAASGEFMNMINTGKERGAKKIHRVYIRINHVCSASAWQISNYGAAILAQIDMLEAQGTRCEINIIYDSQGRSALEGEAFIMTAKHADQALDLDKMAFCLLNSGFQRRLGFRWLEHNPHCPASYGSCEHKYIHKNLKNINAIRFDPITMEYRNAGKLNTHEDAQAYVAEVFQRYEDEQALKDKAA